MTNEASIMNIQINWIRCSIKILFLNHYPIGNDIRILQFHPKNDAQRLSSLSGAIVRITPLLFMYSFSSQPWMRHLNCVYMRHTITKHTWKKSLENNPVSARRCDLKSRINLTWCGDAFFYMVPTKILHLCLMKLRPFSCLNLEG